MSNSSPILWYSRRRFNLQTYSQSVPNSEPLIPTARSWDIGTLWMSSGHVRDQTFCNSSKVAIGLSLRVVHSILFFWRIHHFPPERAIVSCCRRTLYGIRLNALNPTIRSGQGFKAPLLFTHSHQPKTRHSGTKSSIVKTSNIMIQLHQTTLFLCLVGTTQPRFSPTNAPPMHMHMFTPVYMPLILLIHDGFILTSEKWDSVVRLRQKNHLQLILFPPMADMGILALSIPLLPVCRRSVRFLAVLFSESVSYTHLTLPTIYSV